MKRKKLSCCLLSGMALALTAQVTDPVLMYVNKQPVTRAEFEYSYNKNRTPGDMAKQSLEQYVDLFVNYKLKVEAAKAMHLDTLSSFKKEYQLYRDSQLLPYFVDTAYIDSVARAVYQRTATILNGADLLHPAHILFRVPASASERTKERIHAKADSIYRVLQAGGGFAQLAKRFSDDTSTAYQGGLLPWIGPKSALKEFEEAAYSLQPGQISKPIQTVIGYHIILMKERKPLAPYDSMKSEIMVALKRQGIEEKSCEHKLAQLVAHSGQSISREQLLERKMMELIKTDAPLRYLIQEYHDGLLMYEASKRMVWDKAKQDTLGLEAFFKKNKKRYAWDAPRFKGFVILATNKEQANAAKKILKKHHDQKDWQKHIHNALATSVIVTTTRNGIYKEGDNAYVDSLFYKKRDSLPVNKKYPYAVLYGKKLTKPKEYTDVKAILVGDYQNLLEKQWISELRRIYSVSVDKHVLETVNKH